MDLSFLSIKEYLMLEYKETYSVQEFMHVFKITQNEIHPLMQKYSNVELAQKAVDDFKIILKRQYRKASKMYHPDKGGSKEDMQVVNQMYKIMMKSLKVINLAQQQRMQTVVVRSYTYYNSSNSTTGGWF